MADKKTIGIYKAYLKEHLSKKRYTHSMNVANSAEELAKRYGADADKAYVAGLLHDVANEIPALELAAIVSKSSLDVCDIEKKAVPLFHGIAGAELVQTLFDIHKNLLYFELSAKSLYASSVETGIVLPFSTESFIENFKASNIAFTKLCSAYFLIFFTSL